MVMMTLNKPQTATYLGMGAISALGATNQPQMNLF
jgi:hypothetical protein